MIVEHIWSEVAETGSEVVVQMKPLSAHEAPVDITLTKAQAFFLVSTLLNSLEQL